MVMSCNMVGDITCIEVLFSRVIISSNIILTIILGYVVCTIRVNGVMFTNKNIVNIIIICFLYMCFIYPTVIKHIS